MAQLVSIDDPDDPRLAPFSAIRERDLVRRDGLFVAEGKVVLTMLASPLARRNGFSAVALLILDSKLPGVADLVDSFSEDVPAYVVPQALMDRVAGFHLHRGILALGRRLEPMDRAGLLASLPDNALVVAASGLSNHDNVGALFRNAAAFGADAVIMDGPCCDPLYRKALRVSVGTVLAVPYSRQSDAGAMIHDLEAAGFAIWGLSPRGTTDLMNIAPSPRMALLMGTEGEGLPERLMAAIRTTRIRQRAEIDSLNVATAAGIALHAIAAKMGRI